MKRVSMTLQLIVILFCVLIIPLVILTAYSGTLMFRYSEDAIARSALSGLDASRQLAEASMANISKNVMQLITTQQFSDFPDLASFQDMTDGYGSVQNARRLYMELRSMLRVIDGAHSAFFYLEGADYVISTDNGIAPIHPPDMGWIESAISERAGIHGVWYPRVLKTATREHNVITFLLPLTKLLTATKGTVAVNLYESQLAEYLRPSPERTGARESLVMDENGVILSHPDKSLLGTDGGGRPFLRQILDDNRRSGFHFQELEGERLLYTYCKSDRTGWVYVGVYSMDQMADGTYAVRRDMMVGAVIILLAGTAAAIFLATWFSRPVRKLARDLRETKRLAKSGGNEVAFLHTAFHRIQAEEASLNSLLRERERDSESLLIASLLQGETERVKNVELVPRMFPSPFFLVAIICMDGYSLYSRSKDPELRNYHRLAFMARCGELFPAGIAVRCVYRGGGSIGMILNFGEEEKACRCINIYDALSDAKAAVLDITGHTATVGVSDPCEGLRELQARAADALEATRYRFIRGADSLILWNPMFGGSKKYIYPSNSERRILNYLAGGELPLIEEELAEILRTIRSADMITCDNMLFIYNQLVGAAIKYLSENNIGTGLIFAERGNIYAELSAIETIEEMNEYLAGFYGDIIAYLHHEETDKPLSHGEKMLRYLNQRYREDIIFEDAAAEIGISYSYMRKLCKELTGKSLADYVNTLRVREMKQLIGQPELTLAEISERAGYRNVYSANRYFRKFEGMLPSEYKNLV